MVFLKSLLAATLVSLSAATSVQTMSANKTEFIQPTNDYTSIVVDTNYAQKHPLRTVLSFEYPSNIKNIRQALNYILENSVIHLLSCKTLARKL